MFIISSLLLNAGLLVFVDFGNFFDKTTEDLQTSNIYYIVSSNLYNDEVDLYLEEDNNIINYQKEESLWGFADSLYNGETRSNAYLINNADNLREVSKWKFIGEYLEETDMSVYLPYRFQLDNGYQLNDKFELKIDEIKFTFTIKGFVEDIYFSGSETGFIGIYLPNETFNQVKSELSDNFDATLIFANLKEVNKDIETKISKLTNADNILSSYSVINEGHSMFSFDIGIVKMARVMMANMIALVIVAFAMIIGIVCMIVIRFRISNTIEDDMTKIGSLKAMGYTSKQIILSITMQFFMIAIIGSIVGISLSYLTTPILSDIFAQQSGLKWDQGLDLIITFISLLSILLVVLIVALITSKRINKLHPIVALRSGLLHHNFKKNHFPFHSTIGNLSFVLALKAIVYNLKQSLMIIIILSAVSFAGTFAVIMFYNTNIDVKTFLETPGVELSNSIVVLDSKNDNSNIIKQIQQMDEVRKTQFIDTLMIQLDGSDVGAFVMSDFSLKETVTIYQGRYPKHANEVAISGNIADMYNKKIGDTIKFNYGDEDISFLICGLTQGAFMAGMNVSLSSDGAKLLNPDFKQQNFYIYLNNNIKTEDFVKELEQQYSELVLSIIDNDKEMQIGASSYISIVSKVGIVICVVTFAIILLILYFVINSSLIRKKRELGIQKAIGFTTYQLMNQFSISFLFPIIIGVLVGCIAGIIGTNPMMSMVQRGMGIMKANYIINNYWILVFSLIIIIFSYLSSMLLTYRIKSISPYTLVSE